MKKSTRKRSSKIYQGKQKGVRSHTHRQGTTIFSDQRKYQPYSKQYHGKVNRNLNVLSTKSQKIITMNFYQLNLNLYRDKIRGPPIPKNNIISKRSKINTLFVLEAIIRIYGCSEGECSYFQQNSKQWVRTPYETRQ